MDILTKRMATRQLGLLGVAGLQLVADAVEQLDIALLRVLLEGGDEGPGHGARRLGGDGYVGSGEGVSEELQQLRNGPGENKRARTKSGRPCSQKT